MSSHGNTAFLGVEGVPWFAFKAWNDATTAINPGRTVCFWNRTAGADHSKIWIREEYATKIHSPSGEVAALRVAGQAMATFANHGSGFVCFAGLMSYIGVSVISFSPLQEGCALSLSLANKGRLVHHSGTTSSGRRVCGFSAEYNISAPAAKRVFIVPWRM